MNLFSGKACSLGLCDCHLAGSSGSALIRGTRAGFLDGEGRIVGEGKLPGEP